MYQILRTVYRRQQEFDYMHVLLCEMTIEDAKVSTMTNICHELVRKGTVLKKVNEKGEVKVAESFRG